MNASNGRTEQINSFYVRFIMTESRFSFVNIKCQQSEKPLIIKVANEKSKESSVGRENFERKENLSRETLSHGLY